MKNLYKGMVAAAILATASFANAGTVSLPGGVTFTELTDIDADHKKGTFSTSFDFVQWWEDSSNNATSLSTMFGGGIPATDVNGLTDYSLTGYGELNTNSATGSFQCNGCEMTFTFEGLGLSLTPSEIANPVYNDALFNHFLAGGSLATFPGSAEDNAAGNPSATIITFTPGLDLATASMNIYLDNTPDLDLGLDVGNKTNAMNGQAWLELSFTQVDFGVVASAADLAVAGLNRADSSFGLDVTGGTAADSFLLARDIRNNPILTTFVDMIGFGLSGEFAKTNGEYDTYSIGGSGTAHGFAVTEPTSIAIFGLGLLGFAAASRRKQS
ncbi:PEP-CTERM sorting domain-containing protein [Colwellia sp. BRX10-9]|uniref:PEP-CTERM sorting domain-containing protein n=3 Tax=unclassified Colwellia TaxID=196834 RepID=UPI0015F455C6|nr:PEP-CTERM sorting domain-containing protein [Colwellia sp. BRX10-9]MBA6381825.1 PEP-CTERM sorting domain-containing protein [Colwellia sp. BRX10-9]